MKHRKLREQSWYPYAVAACSAVLLYVLLEHISNIWAAVAKVSGYFLPVLLGCVLAYLMNPLAKLYQRTLFKKVKKESLAWPLSVGLAVATVVAFLLFLLGTLIPQLIESVMTLVNNLDDYMASLRNLLERWGIDKHLDLDKLNMVDNAAKFLSKNLSSIVSASSKAGKGVANWVIALVLSVYLLAAKESLRVGVRRLARAVLNRGNYERVRSFLHRCDGIHPGGTGPGLPCSGIIAPVKCVAAAFHMSAVVRPACALLVEVPACVSLAPGIPLFKFTHQACPLLLGELLFRIGLDRFLDLIRHIRIIIRTDCLVYNIEDFVNSREKIVRTAHLSHLIYRTCRCRSLKLRKAEVSPPEVIVLTPSGSQPPGPRCGSEHIGNQRSPVRIQEGE